MKSKKMTVAVLGTGNMGTALAVMLSRGGHSVRLWNYEGDQEPLNQVREARENKKYLPGVSLPENISAEPDLENAVQGATVVFFVVPSNFVEAIIKRVAGFLPCGVVCVDATKGMDEKSLGLTSDVIEKLLPKCLSQAVVSLSGPAIATDMVKGGWTAMNIASKSERALTVVHEVLAGDTLKLIATNDMVGVEVAGAFKNVYAIAMGICDGLKYPLNTKSALLVIALQEIAGLIKKMGGQRETVYGLAGLGDLVGTGLCGTSRNRRFGEYLAQGKSKDEATKAVGQVVEGINASRILKKLSVKHKIKMPFADMEHAIVWKEKNSAGALSDFLRQL
jgi:glycerol-3-phosphate dehydrogenase (NAD(P)+)